MSFIISEFSVRVVVCDHYLTKPVPGFDVTYSDFRGADIKQVPVLRIFGPSADGYKTCLHVHGVFPYFYIPCPTQNPEPQLLYQIAASLDKALNIALKQATSNNQHVYKITLVKGLPFYGFHNKEHLYLKVFLYSPNLIKQAVELCSNGAILGQTFQPHESHLNFTLQFFIDFNLFGMSNIDLQKVSFRKTGNMQNSDEPALTDENRLKAESICFYEVDCIASHIINRQRIGKGDIIENPGLEEVWKQEIERRKQLNISLASKSLTQRRIKSEETESHYKFHQLCLIQLSGTVDKPVEIKFPQEQIYYPAESIEGTQLLDAVDVSIHLPGNSFNNSLTEISRINLDEPSNEQLEHTIVDESVALNSSLSIHHSQVLLSSEDIDLLDMLADMDEKPVDKDSVMGTPPNEDEDNEIDDTEYSQIFNEETIVTNIYEGKDNAEISSPTWNDSFWDGAHIPQLDGTFDDEHVKKVRKRKPRPLRLGLSKPKEKKNIRSNDTYTTDIADSNLDINNEINASRDTIDSISSFHLKKNIKTEPQSILEKSMINNNLENGCEKSLFDLVNEVTVNNDLKAAEIYDKHNKYFPEPGTSTNFIVKAENSVDKLKDMSDDSSESSVHSESGIVSFYNTSKCLDISLNKSLETNLKKQKNISDEHSFNKRTEVDRIVITPKFKPPTRNYIISSLDKYNIPKIKSLCPFYSDPNDVGDRVELGHMLLKVQSKTARDQKPFDNVLSVTSIEEWRQLMFLQTNEMSDQCCKPDALKKLLSGNKHCVLQPIMKAPTTNQIKKSLENIDKTIQDSKSNLAQNEISNNFDELDNSQALGLHDEINTTITPEEKSNEVVASNVDESFHITMQPDGSFLCFNSDIKKQNLSLKDEPVIEMDYLTIMLAEVHTAVRADLHPDPTIDPIQAIFVMVTDCPPDSSLCKTITQALVIADETPLKHLDRCVTNVKVFYYKTELEILEKIVELIKSHDPDIMCGYEMELNSWGYILERAQVLGMEIVREVSRVTEKYRQKRWKKDDNDFEGRIIGRITFNVWRLFRHELALSSYSFENCMYEILKERVPKYSYAQLAEWWNHESRILRWIPVEYYLTKLYGTVRMLRKLDIINRTSELARLFGLQWWEVLSRGSQFRVESLMLRAARPLNLIALSPSVKQRAAMRAPECLPLIFEPESRFYSDPVIVLDFQSLYPSMMIAYNYCFSTCIGRVQNINGDAAYEFGAWRLRISKSKLEALVKNELVHWSPVGVGFVKPSVRRGVLPTLLRRILAARQAVKKSMKQQTDESIKKAMHSRQLGLKLIANVTYGYTAANFSGRMPCVEVGDSVVAKGRETLERAIKLVRDNKEWNVKVVYGDTDSMFVLVPGATRTEAFRIGQEIADAVTADNPSPVALKLEKVYQPCILQTKKRYVGYMYESPEQEKPVYEAKGIETVRRDGCPVAVKLLHRCLCELFETGDMSRVKRIVESTLYQLASGSTPMLDLMFTREYHGPTGYRPGAVAPPNEIAKRIGARDRRARPRAGQRVPWVVAGGAPGAALGRLARSPAELARRPVPPHVAYYVTRAVLPPLHRCLSLLGVDVFKWVVRWRRAALRDTCGACGAHAAARPAPGPCAADVPPPPPPRPRCPPASCPPAPHCTRYAALALDTLMEETVRIWNVQCSGKD
ncbi:hypothetical protein evm_011317 [Chilo suppressalis]|nr:hypothetical protein evm_011317 [Chilo suppressalis]